MTLDDGMFVLIFGGFALCGLYFWSALKERAKGLWKAKKDLAQFQQAQHRQHSTSADLTREQAPTARRPNITRQRCFR